MGNVYSEYIGNVHITEILNTLYTVAITSSIVTIITVNPVISVLFLIITFLSVSCYLLVINICFIGISYLLVYVGAVSILFLFILMLVNVRQSELTHNTRGTFPLALLMILIFSYTAYKGLISSIKYYPNNTIYLYMYIKSLISNGPGFKTSVYNNLVDYNITLENKNISSIAWDKIITSNTDITSIGNIIYSSHGVWLIITSIILLLSMVGAIIITVR